VIQLSALLGQGVDGFWAAVTQFRSLQTASGKLTTRREQQAQAWMWERIEAGLRQAFRTHPQVRKLLPQWGAEVTAGRLAASTAARQLLQAYEHKT
jgi:LAO/AO transport system kinase